jgi:hypothetical protein
MGTCSFDFDEEALKASGVSEERRLDLYLKRLCALRKDLHRCVPSNPDPFRRAEALFHLLWSLNPVRYKAGAPFRLNDVIDAHVKEEIGPIGNCLGLTVFYRSLLLGMAVGAGALFLENGFGLGPHVLTLLEREGEIIHVENTLSNGFAYQGQLRGPEGQRWGDRELVADIYHSAANESFQKGRFEEARRNYQRALDFNPGYERARLNMTILIDKMESFS